MEAISRPGRHGKWVVSSIMFLGVGPWAWLVLGAEGGVLRCVAVPGVGSGRSLMMIVGLRKGGRPKEGRRKKAGRWGNNRENNFSRGWALEVDERRAWRGFKIFVTSNFASFGGK